MFRIVRECSVSIRYIRYVSSKLPTVVHCFDGTEFLARKVLPAHSQGSGTDARVNFDENDYTCIDQVGCLKKLHPGTGRAESLRPGGPCRGGPRGRQYGPHACFRAPLGRSGGQPHLREPAEPACQSVALLRHASTSLQGFRDGWRVVLERSTRCW